jgi:hypothetical protein
MHGAAAVVSEEDSQIPLGDAKTAQLMERLERLLREAAEVEVELSRADDSIRGVLHYSVIEGQTHVFGAAAQPGSPTTPDAGGFRLPLADRQVSGMRCAVRVTAV